MNPSHKRWIAGTGMVVLLVVAFAAWVVRPRSVEWEDDADLRLAAESVPDELNSYLLFRAAANAVVRPESLSLFRDYLSGACLGDPDVHAVLSSNAVALAFVRQGVERPAHSSEGELQTSGYDSETRWRLLSQLLAVECREARLEGRREQALQTCGVLLRFGKLVAATAWCTYEHSVGVVALKTGLGVARDLARDAGSDQALLEQLATALEDLPPPADGFARALKREYVERVARVEFGADPYAPRMPPIWRLYRLVPSYSLHPASTRALLARVFRGTITNSTLNQASSCAIYPEGLFQRRRLAAFFAPNAAGDYQVSQMAEELEHVLRWHRGFVTDLAATRVVVAVQRFRRGTGRLPALLQDLVPEFLDAVPVDPYDGKPLRYDPARGVVYAVDTNLVDDGGEVPPPPEGYAEDAARDRRSVGDRVYWVVAPAKPSE